MNKTIFTWTKIAGAIAICFLIDALGHAILPASPYMTTMAPSVLSRTIGIVPMAMAYILLLFIVIAITIYTFIRSSVHPLQTGIQAGFSLGGLWFIAFFEPWAILGTPLVSEFIMGVNDSVPVVLLGGLLGILFTRKEQRKKQPLKIPLSLVILPICYIIGRYFLYSAIRIHSGNSTRPVETMLWTVSMGLWIGYMYYLFLKGKQQLTIKLSMMDFCIRIFGLNWVLFNLFIPLVFQATLMDFIIRSVGDTIFVIIGVMIMEHISKRNEANRVSSYAS